MKKVDRLIIFGGTHGNELSGVHLVNKWLSNKAPLDEQLPSCSIVPVIANPEAVKLCRRYKDSDLNRLFTEENCTKKTNNEDISYEKLRVKELYELYGKDSVDKKALLDLHNTTSNMGCSIIVEDPRESNCFSMQMAAYVQKCMGEEICRLITYDATFMSTVRVLAKYGIDIEVGPQPQGVLRADVLRLQETAVYHAMDFLKMFNDGVTFEPKTLTTYNVLENIQFTGKANLDSIIHEDFLDSDFKVVKPTDPIFRSANGKEMLFEEIYNVNAWKLKELCPIFINEAAYMENNIAFVLTSKTQITVPSVGKLQ